MASASVPTSQPGQFARHPHPYAPAYPRPPASMMGLLTTVAELPHNYKIRYIKVESPLDLSVRPSSTEPSAIPALPTASTVAQVRTVTPPRTPSPTVGQLVVTKRRAAASVPEDEAEPAKKKPNLVRSELWSPAVEAMPATASSEPATEESENNPPSPKAAPPKLDRTPQKPIRRTDASAARTSKNPAPAARERKPKAGTVRKLKFDEYKSSPVSGTIIRSLDEIAADEAMESGDIDPEFNIVEVTDEVRAEIATIPNVIGGYGCKLCRIQFEDVFGLARHRCSCIVLLDYKCPECGKRFNCPANLASHRRWHKPRGGAEAGGGDAAGGKKQAPKSKAATAAVVEADAQFACGECGKRFKRAAYLRKHSLTHSRAAGGGRKETGETATVMVAATLTVSGAAATTSSQCESRSSRSSSPAVSECSLASSRDSGMMALVIAENAEHGDDQEEEEEQHQQQQPAEQKHHFRMFEGAFTEEENLAASVLAHLRNGTPSVIRHTTVMAV